MAASPSPTTVLGVDIGGTFTDFILVQAGEITVHKRLTTPDDPSRALLAGVAALSVPPDADVIHGSTIATNALLERRGARTALITTRGFADVLAIGRQDRPDLYALVPEKPRPLVPARWRFEVSERVSASGAVLEPLSEQAVEEVVEHIRAENIESVAVCLLFSFLHPAHERMLAARLREHASVSLSSEILPEYREYERTSTTVINAYVSPLMQRYLGRVEAGLAGRRLRIMQSNGGVITASAARREAARTVLSGPAGGAVGAFHVTRLAGYDHIISLDMGGTSTDVALFPGQVPYTREAVVAGLPLRLPIVDVHTVGAGGGSVARVDVGGALQVGPDSVGADPGPACYGRGEIPATSDANLVLGRLHADHFLGGEMRLHPQRSYDALARLAVDMGVRTPEEAAWGVIQVANATMERAIRAISVERGYDPRAFTLVPFGGAGPLHACALASALRIPRIVVPRTPGVLSALGMTVADLFKDYSQAVLAGQHVPGSAALDTIFQSLEARAVEDLLAEGIPRGDMALERALDMRYAGQSHEITVPQPAAGDWATAFHAAHERRYGHQRPAEPVEVVNARLRAVGRGPKPVIERLAASGTDPSAAVVGDGQAWFTPDGPVGVLYFERALLGAGNVIPGPAIIFQLDTTTVVEPGWQVVVDEWGNLVLTA